MFKIRKSCNADSLSYLAAPGIISDWRTVCLIVGMSALAFKVSRKSGEYVKPMIAPSHSKQAHFGVLDAAVIGFFLACAGGLIYLLLQM